MHAHGGGLRACEAYGRAVVERVPFRDRLPGTIQTFDFGWSLLETRKAELTWGKEIGSF